MGADEAVAEVVTRFNADLDSDVRTRGCVFRFVPRNASSWGTAMWVVEDVQAQQVAAADADGLAADSVEAHVSIMADRIQEGVMGWLGDRAWPKCPDHEHPLVPDLLSGTAVWRCPADDGRQWVIGALGKLH